MMTPEVARIRLEQYEGRTSTWSTATYNDGTEKALHEIARSLLVEVDRLKVEVEALENDKKHFASASAFLMSRTSASNWLTQQAEKYRAKGTAESVLQAEAIESLAQKIRKAAKEDVPPGGCGRCKGSGVDPEHVAEENYGDAVREVRTPCDGCGT